MNIFVTVLTLGAVFTSSEAGPQGRISYGQIAGERQFPFMVGISAYSGDNAYVRCGGAIISNHYVLTAAHCLDNLTEVTLHFGSTNFSAPEMTLTVGERHFIIHKNYRNYYNDIALIHCVDNPIRFTNNVNKVNLPSKRDVVARAHDHVIGMGWGTDENEILQQHNLKYVTMRVMTKKACRPYSRRYHFFNQKTLCLMTDHGSSCMGDSGSPLIMASNNNMLVGLSSFGMNANCALSEPVGYVKITKYLNWIKKASGVK